MRRAAALGLVVAIAATAIPRLASAQACCSGAATVTPGRLQLYEDALVGIQARAGSVYGSFGSDGTYTRAQGARETDLEQDLVASLRFLEHGQVSLLAPMVETYRAATGISEWGGGPGDVNLGGRWDFTIAGASDWPGLGVLAGITFPSGTPVEKATKPLATDATGTGAVQGVVGGSVEELFGSTFVGASVLFAKRAPYDARGHRSTLALQTLFVGSAAYSFTHATALGGSITYATEGDAAVDDVTVPESGRRQLTLSLAALHTVSSWRFQGGVFASPPISGTGANEPASIGAMILVGKTWSFDD